MPANDGLIAAISRILSEFDHKHRGFLEKAKEHEVLASRAREEAAKIERVMVDLSETLETLQEDGPEITSSGLPVGSLQIKRGSLAAVIAEILENSKRLDLDSLVVELSARGFGKKAKDFRSVVNTAIWRKQELFKKNEDGTFSLASEYNVVD